MKKFKIIGVLLIFAFTLMGCSSGNKVKKDNLDTIKNSQENNIEVQKISSSDIDDVMQIVDIRPEAEYIGWKNEKENSGHISNAIDFPIEWLTYGHPEKYIDIELKRRGIDKNKKTVIYSNGDVVEKDYKKFKDLGFNHVYALDGGFNQYITEGKSTEKLEGYERYVSPQWVEDLTEGKKPEKYDNDDYRIVEITLASEKDDYEKGHIKGAVKINADDLNHIPGPRNLADYESIPKEKQLTFWGLPTDGKIKEVLENSGITKDTTVILYASDKATTAANRAALVMDYAGVKDIRLLNGGKMLWNLEKKPLVTESTKIEIRDFGAKIPQNSEIIYDYQKELKLIEDTNAVIASVRSWDEYLGKKSGYTYIGEAGDIENARFAYAGSDPYAMEDYRNLDNTMFNYKIIADRWAKWGIVPEKTVSFHCGTGWRASEAYYIAKALGWKNTGVYVGGWYQWTKKPGSPVMKKGLPKNAPEESPMEYFHK